MGNEKEFRTMVGLKCDLLLAMYIVELFIKVLTLRLIKKNGGGSEYV